MKTLKEYISKNINENLTPVSANLKLNEIIPGFNEMYEEYRTKIESKLRKEFSKIVKGTELEWGVDNADWGPKLLYFSTVVGEKDIPKKQLDAALKPVKGYCSKKHGGDNELLIPPYGSRNGYSWFVPVLAGKHSASWLKTWNMQSVQECVRQFNLFAERVDKIFGTNVSKITGSDEFLVSVALIYVRHCCINNNGRIPKDISKFLKDEISIG